LKLYNYFENIEVLETDVTHFDLEIKGVTSRLNEVEDGFIFVCIKGMRNDGHSFASLAKQRGAVLLVVDSVTEFIIASELPYIKVENTRAVLARMCAKSYGNPERMMKLVGVTGTNGKTSTCRLLSEIYLCAGQRVKTIGTLDGGLTTPDPEDFFRILKNAFDNGYERVIMEASSHSLSLDKLDGVRFDYGIFTNLSPEHLDFHKCMDDYAMAKARLFKNTVCGLYNFDDSYYKTVSSLSSGRTYTYSYVDPKAHFYIKDFVSKGTEGFEYTLVTQKEDIRIKSKLSGKFNVYNTLAASSLAYIDGLDADIVKEGILSVENVSGRLERLILGDVPFSVYIDYAHSPDALEKVLCCIRDFKRKKQRITVLFGCGGDRDRSKRRVMGQIASRLADFVIVTSDNSRSESAADIIDEIMKGIDKERPHVVIENRREAIEFAIMNARENDIILLAGKGHENYEIDSLGKRYFNEKEIAAEAVSKRLKRK
jgi:UDP-N-acetylmuramoyl-L-alanyl-D-glutamate--2,6-diaminopimelate ligase